MSHYLCEELIDAILERLPPKSLLRFRSVSKSWHCRISSPSFIRKHAVRSVATTTHKKILIRQKICYDGDVVSASRSRSTTDEYTRRELAKFAESDYEITGSCFGVVCMRTNNYHNPSVILWNSSVRRKLTIPDYPCRHFGVSFGFGFDPITDDYNIVGLCIHTSFVYSIKTNSWSEIQVPTTSRLSRVKSYGFFADGALHWVVKCKTNNIAHHYILAFNLSTHVYGIISLPNPNLVHYRLTFIKESNLALISSGGYEKEFLWSIKEENNNVVSWSIASKLKSLKVENSQGYNPFTGVHYTLEVDSDYSYTLHRDIWGETLELLDKETC